jgi:CHAT domain-containing protein
VEHLVDVFPKSTVLLGHEATVAQVQSLFEHADVLHLACHGHFRPDNPLFSALRLADGWLTVQDMEAVRLRCRLVTLSACETGVSAIAPGDELLGLVRGFLSAGAQHLLVSLWTVDDAATTSLMQTFYRSFCAGAHPATALQTAQRALLAEYPHPFFWSPFVLL